MVIGTGADALRLGLKGRLDAAGAEAVEAAFTAQVAGAPGDVLVDIAGVPFAGSLGIRMLISAGRVATRRGRRMILVAPQPPVAEVFSVVALDDLIPVVADEAAALALLAA
ncbi:STAS domain-containing protein [Roseomonas sp. CECT 9278]|uniref:STAS domain-containing protein n=1 Tax=Roseomonas sp. CECT 9278 TaxID=2845823 RepID=UPI001E52309E|nr:STAS domain-containing protein [Roseomonas sp. CECT 9278]